MARSRFFSIEPKVQVDSCLSGWVSLRGRGPGILSEAQQVELGAGAGREPLALTVLGWIMFSVQCSG